MSHSFLCKLLYILYSPISFFFLKIQGVKIKGFIYTGGVLFVSRANKSSISLGTRCRFMSKSYGNLIGLNHRCILSTYGRESRIDIGERCSFSGVSIRSFAPVKIGNNVRVGANTVMISGDAHFDDPRSSKSKPITVEDNVWIGANVMVLKGVIIGRNSLIGAGSVVTKSIPANVVAAGNPCKVIRQLDEETIKKLERK